MWCLLAVVTTTTVSAAQSGGESTEQLPTRTHNMEQPSTTHPDRFSQGENAEQRTGERAEHNHREKNIAAAGGRRAPNGCAHHNGTPAPAEGLPSARHPNRRPHNDGDDDDCNHFGYTDDDAHESPITSVAIRPPSSTSPEESPTRVGVARGAAAALQIAGRLWGKDRDRDGGGVLMGAGGRGGGGVEGGKPGGAHRGKGAKAGRWNHLGGLGRKRRTCRDVELADWIEANTNLVNVSPW